MTMKKRLLSILMTLCLLTQLFPITASAVRLDWPHPSAHCVCGGGISNHKAMNGHTTYEGVYFTKDGTENTSGNDISKMNAIQLEEDLWEIHRKAANNQGKTFYYYLANDVTLTGQIYVWEGCTFVICLHGHTLTCNIMGQDPAFNLWKNARLVITDCQMSGDRGLITGDSGAAVYVPKTSTLDLYGVSICMTSTDEDGLYDHNSTPIGGVYNCGTFNMYGGSITGNRAQDAQNNLWLDETAALKIGGLGLDKQAQIGISGTAGKSILTGYADDFSGNFTSDDRTMTVSTVRENGFTDLTLQEAVYTLTLDLGENDEPVALEAEQGKSLHEMNVQAPERQDAAFDGWYTEEGEQIDVQAPLHLTGDTTIYAHWTQADLQSEDTILTYDPDAPITKQEAAKTLYQMARQLGLDTEEGAGRRSGGSLKTRTRSARMQRMLFAGLMQSIFSQKKTAASILPMN